jgi:hypothetical protein
MPFIQMDVGNVKEPKPVAAGRYGLTIAEAKYNEPKVKDGEKKGANIDVSIGIDGHIDAPNIRHFIALPKPDDKPETVQFKKLMLKRFMAQFSIPYNEVEGFNTDDFSGATAQGELTLTEPDAETGAVYNRLRLDKLPGDSGPE